jgi:hypothetical protein
MADRSDRFNVVAADVGTLQTAESRAIWLLRFVKKAEGVFLYGAFPAAEAP